MGLANKPYRPKDCSSKEQIANITVGGIVNNVRNYTEKKILNSVFQYIWTF
jgi:hypothetical protein